MTSEQRAAIEQALEALEKMMEEFKGHDLPYGSKAYALAKDARLGLITAMTAALEQSAQEKPAAWMNKHGACMSAVFKAVEASAHEYTIPLYTRPKAREHEQQKPVAWVGEISEEAELMLEKPRFRAVPLYTHLAREWVGLTDTEKYALADDVARRGVPIFEAICEAEAKLREKNYG